MHDSKLENQYIYNKVTVRDLQSNELINSLLDQRVHSLCINNNRVFSVDHGGTIRIWNLNQKILKEYSKSDLHSASPIYVDSKRIAIFTKEYELVIYDLTGNLRKKY